MAKINGLNTTLPKATEEILRQIIHHDRVKEHRVVHCDDNCVVLECDWEVKLGSRDLEKGFSAKGVQAIEPVSWHIPFVFPNAPILPSLRKNFPRTKFPHINPSKALDVVWPCITENGITSFLLANGLVKLLAQMDSWLDRAALDRLMVDEQGWEPIIFDNYGGSFIDVDSTLIPCALEVIDKQTITAKVAEEKGAFHTFSNRPLYVFAVSDDSSGAHAPIDILELFLPESSATKQFQNIPVTNREELLSFAQSLEGIPELHNNLIVLPTPDFSASEWLRIKLDNLDKTFPHLKANRKNSNAIGCIVIFCIPRPAHIIGGSSNIEVTPFFVRLSNDKNTNPEVVPLTYIQSCSQEVLQNVSHPYKREVKHLAFLGTGSVGSKIAISLARSGSYSIHLVDNGVFRPHNMARYGIAGVGVHEGWPKAAYSAEREHGFWSIVNT
ncbi:hypothetical protein AltI4_12620 [Alteromonas sp. I4]|nr:hypothetical protein AltI4_12620 [Alteromonas sp. I4]